MEKIIAIDGYDVIGKYDLDEVQKWLDKGWKVKSITMHNIKTAVGVRVNAIVVLEKTD